LIRLPASLKGEIEKLIVVVGDRRDDWWAAPKVDEYNRPSKLG
jgi:hypothetical protein